MIKSEILDKNKDLLRKLFKDCRVSVLRDCDSSFQIDGSEVRKGKVSVKVTDEILIRRSSMQGRSTIRVERQGKDIPSERGCQAAQVERNPRSRP